LLPEVVPHVHPEGEYHVNDEWGTEGKKGNVYKPKTNAGSGDTHFFAYCATNTKRLPFYITFEPIQWIFHKFSEISNILFRKIIKFCNRKSSF